MNGTFNSLSLPLLALTLGLPASCPARPAPAASAMDAQAPLTEQQRIVHVLNRLGFGPQPGDVERVRKMGIRAYIRQQLNPQSIDDSATDKVVARLDTLQMSSSHLMDEFNADIRRFLDQQKMFGNPAEMKMRYGIDIKKNSAPAGKQNPAAPSRQDHSLRDAIRCIGELQDAKLMHAVLSERQLNEVLTDFWENHFNIDVRKDTCRALKVADEREVIRPHVLGKFRALLGASAHSPAMLVYLDNNENSVVRERSGLEKKAIEWYISAKFGMNASGMMSAKEGPNENYGREILELHTLGVDGGYTQKDVQEAARCFSGWTFSPFSGKFNFDANRHDNGRKIILGKAIPQGMGEKDGEMLLDILAREPATARFISRKLCQRFVSDDPPKELVARIAAVFTKTDGDIRQVVQAIFESPEFFSPAAYRAKIKSPFEYAVSAVRAADGHFTHSMLPFMDKMKHLSEGAAVIGYGADKLSAAKQKSLNWQVYVMGEPLFAHAAPTGYPEASAKWVSPGALIDRLNFAMALSAQDVSDVRIAPENLIKGVDVDQPQQVFDRLAEGLLHGELSAKTRQVILRNLTAGEKETASVNVGKLTALILGSPEFQRR